MNDDRRVRPPMPSASDHSATTSDVIVTPLAGREPDLDGDRIAYVAVLCTPNGKHRRRVFLTLAAALSAVERAERRGLGATVTLAELRAVGEVTP